MKIQQVTPNYNQNKVNTNFKAGKINIINPELFLTDELEAIAKNDEFKKLAKIAGEKRSDLSIKKVFILDRYIASLHFNNVTFDVMRSWASQLSDALRNFRVNDMMKKLEEKHQKELIEKNARKEALKLIDDFNKYQENINPTAPAEPV